MIGKSPVKFFEAGGGAADAAQRNMLALADVEYLITAEIRLTKRAEKPKENLGKYIDELRRRASRGKCFHRPVLGCREFACHFAPLDGTEKSLEWNQAVGLMLYDIQFGRDGKNHPGFFEAVIHNGSLHCDAMSANADGEPAIKIHGWNQEEAYV